MHSKIGDISLKGAKFASVAAAVFALFLLSGCFEISEEIYINPDGSAVLVQDLIMESMMAGMMALNPAEDPFAEIKEKDAQDPAPLTDGIITDLAFEKSEVDGKTRFRYVIQVSDVWKLTESEKALQWINEVGGGEEPSAKPAPFALSRGEKRAINFRKTLDMTSVPTPGGGGGMDGGFPGGPGEPGLGEPPQAFPPFDEMQPESTSRINEASPSGPEIEYASYKHDAPMQSERTPPEGSEAPPDEGAGEDGGKEGDAPPDEFGGMPDISGMESPFGGDPGEFDEEWGRKMAAQMFSGKYYTVRLHVPKLLNFNSEESGAVPGAKSDTKDVKKETPEIPAGVKLKKFDTAEWKIEISDLMSDTSFTKELTAEFRLKGGPNIPVLAFPLAGLFVLIIAVFAATRKKKGVAAATASATGAGTGTEAPVDATETGGAEQSAMPQQDSESGNPAAPPEN